MSLSGRPAGPFSQTSRAAHDLTPTAEAAELEIRADAQHLPAFLAAGVLFFHRQNVTDLNVHRSLPLDALPIGARRLLGLVVAVLVVMLSLQLIRQVLLLHPMARVAVRILVALFALEARAVGVDVLQLTRMGPAFPARTSAMAASMDMTTELDFGAVASNSTASASGSRASGRPSWSALSTQDFTIMPPADSKADILTCRAQDAPARTDQSPASSRRAR